MDELRQGTDPTQRRHKTNDHLWFTFFHEPARILLHGKSLIFIENTIGAQSKAEVEANLWAADFLIPRNSYSELAQIDAITITDESLEAFSEKVGIAPGIVVGRLQHEGRIGHNQFNHHKIRYQWTPEVESAPPHASLI